MWRRWDQSLKSSVRRRRMEKQFTSRIWWNPCHLKNVELAKHLQKYKGRVVLRRGNVKDEEGCRAVRTEQRCFSVSDGSGQVPGHHLKASWYGWRNKWRNFSVQVKMTEAPRLLRLPKEECSEIWTRIPPRQRPASWNNIDDLVVRLQRNFCGHPQAGLLWERKNEELLFEKGCGKVPTWECLYAHKKSLDYSYRGMWMIWNCLERSRTGTLCCQICRKKSTLRIQRHE